MAKTYIKGQGSKLIVSNEVDSQEVTNEILEKQQQCMKDIQVQVDRIFTLTSELDEAQALKQSLETSLTDLQANMKAVNDVIMDVQ